MLLVDEVGAGVVRIVGELLDQRQLFADLGVGLHQRLLLLHGCGPVHCVRVTRLLLGYAVAVNLISCHT